MPLFFIVSGLCWNVERNRNIAFGDFVKKKFNSYIIPYFKICLICLLLLGIPEAFLQYGASNVLSRGNTEWLPHCSPVWFLTCLFCAEVLMWLIMKAEKEWTQYLMVIIAAILGYITSLTGKLPWNLDSAFTAIPLLFVGIKIKKFIIEKPIDYRKVSILILASMVFFIRGVSVVDFDGNHYENIPLMYVSSIVISLTVVMATKLVGGQILPVVGQETLLLMGYNYAINGVLLIVFPSIKHSWLMAVSVITIGCILVFMTRKVKIIKKILV